MLSLLALAALTGSALAAKEVLKNFDASFPHWEGRGYEIAGFGWWQGHKDTGSAVHAARYEKTLVQLIQTLRRDFDAPQAKFVVAVGCGNEGREGTGLQIAEAQLAVDGSKGKYPEFKGNVKTVETRDFWPDPEKSPKNQVSTTIRTPAPTCRSARRWGRGCWSC